MGTRLSTFGVLCWGVPINALLFLLMTQFSVVITIASRGDVNAKLAVPTAGTGRRGHDNVATYLHSTSRKGNELLCFI